jgi:predicted lipoprotein with Yx(FWY)xxD motif
VNACRVVPLAGAVAAAAVALAGCGAYGTSVAGRGVPAAAAAPVGQEQAPATATGPQPKILQVTTELPGFGPVVVTGRGRTVYRFDGDGRHHPPRPTCSGVCATMWRPVIVGRSGVALAGIDQRLLGTVHRPEGMQATLAGWPLYNYVGDMSFGQAAGEGFAGAWFAIAPDGSKARWTGAGRGVSDGGMRPR